MLKIGSTVYEVTGSTTKKNIHGKVQTFTDLKGKRGADYTLIETEGFSLATLIAFGAGSHRRIPVELIHR